MHDETDAKLRSASDLARATGRTPQAVGKWLRDPRWTFGPPPWPRSVVPDVQRWMAAQLEAGGKKLDPKDALFGLKEQRLKEDIRKIRAQADTYEVSLARERGRLLDADEVERGRIARITAVRHALMGLGASIAPQLAGQPAVECQRLIDDACRRICEQFARR